MKSPVFSVIIPAHNEEEVIEKAIRSIQKQTFSNFEIIISNDGSTDKTREIVENMMKKDKRIKILNREKGHSAAYARNRGAEGARGKILIFLDADTFISENTLEEIAGVKLNVDAFAFDCIPKNNTLVNYALSGLVVPIVAKKNIYSKEDGSPLMFFCITNTAFKKIKGYDESIFYFEDEDFSKRFYKAGYKTAFVPKVYQYFELPSDISGFVRQAKWIARGLNSIKNANFRRRVKLFWLFKTVFLIFPLTMIFDKNLFLLSIIITAGFTYISLIKRNRNPFKSLMALPFLYAKTIIICYKLILKSIQDRIK